MLALWQQNGFWAKINEKSHVFGDIDFAWILGAFWEAKIYDFRDFFEQKWKRKIRWFLEGLKIAFWGLKSKLRTKCGGPCGPGGRNIRMGEGLFAKNLRLSFDAGFRGRHKGMKAINVRHARLSLREAADVLRTYRRAARWVWKAESECQQGVFAAIHAPCPKKLWKLWKKHVL